MQGIVDKVPLTQVWLSKCCKARVEIQFRINPDAKHDEKADFYCSRCGEVCEPVIDEVLRDLDRSQKRT